MSEGFLPYIPSINLNEMPKIEYNNTTITTSLMSFMVTLVKLLRSSEGRNKLCGLLQYLSKFSAACIIYTIDTNEIKSNINKIELIYNRHNNLKRIEKSMSNSRKIFGFLKFIEDLKIFYTSIYESSFNFTGILKAFNCLSSCFHHFLDNLVWASNVGIINPIFTGEIKWKTSKNFFSLIKTFIKLTTNITDFKYFYYNSWINNENEVIHEDYTKIVERTINNRSKLRMKTLCIILSILKMITQLYSLKFNPITSNLHPIIVALCGIIHSALSLFKNFIKTRDNHKKILKSFSKQEEKININGILVNQISSVKSKSFIRRNSNSFELSLLERQPNRKLLDDKHYFDNYFLDFNKDFPIVPELVLKGYIGDFQGNN